MALGTMTMVESRQAAQGPVFYDRVTLVCDSNYPSGGSLGMDTALRTLTKDGRVPFAICPEDGKGFVFQYDVANLKLLMYEQDSGGALVETQTANQSGVTIKLGIWSK